MTDMKFKTNIGGVSMNKKLKNRKIKIILYGGIICIASMLSTVKIDTIYANHNDIAITENLLINTTLTEIVYNASKEITKGPSKSSGKVAYITIDDGPSKYTEEIIKILNKYDAKATFFMIDRNMRNYPDQVKRVIENGNSAGFHSVSHDIHELYKNKYSAKEEFDINSKTFFNITGENSKIVRLPYGSKPYTPRTSYEALVEAGYKMWDWSIDTQDWKATSNEIVENVVNYSRNQNDIVVLMHEKRQTVDALESVLKYLKEEEYEFLPIGQNQEPKNYWIGNLNE